MSEKRFSPVEGMSCLLVGDLGVGISTVDACDLLNEQAETIEVLREWIRENEMMVRMMIEIADSERASPIFKPIAKRRIAALEGE